MNILLKGENKLKKSGFTMIELLGIITILATILLVSFPTLINVTRRDKERQYNDMTNTLCKAGETYIYENQSLYPELKDGEGVFYLRISELVGNELVNKSETNPKTKKLVTKNLLKYEVKSDKTLNCTYLDHSLGTLLKDNGDGELSVGDKYEYEVKPGEKQKFYVLKVEDDKVNLIMDRNICEDGTTDYREDNNYCRYPWHDKLNNNSYGPDTAMTKLYNGTKKWTNVPDMVMNYIDESNKENSTKGYVGIITNIETKVTTITGKQSKVSEEQVFGTLIEPLKSRLPKLSELTLPNLECTENNSSCNAWLLDNLKYWSSEYPINNDNIAGTSIYNISGYWTLSSYNDSGSRAINLYFTGHVSKNDSFLQNNYVGVRPVITVPIMDLS